MSKGPRGPSRRARRLAADFRGIMSVCGIDHFCMSFFPKSFDGFLKRTMNVNLEEETLPTSHSRINGLYTKSLTGSDPENRSAKPVLTTWTRDESTMNIAGCH